MPYPGLRVRVLGSVVIIQPLESAGEQALSLTVDLKSGRVELAPQAPIKNDCLVVLAMVGVMSLSSQAAVALVTGAEQVATVSGHPIFRVTQTKVLEAERRTRDPGDDRYMALLKAALDPEAHGRGLYFSLGLNLTLSAEHRATGLADGASAEKHMYAKEDARFFWNRNLCTKLIDANAHGFIYPLVQGFVGQLDSLVFRNKERYASASITLIARRSVQRVGTRHWRRGADKQGNVANFVETEQLVDFDNGKHVASHVQIRGSIPLLWTQIPNIKYKPPTEMAGRSAHASVFDQHMSHLLEVYKDVDILNLAKQSGSEGRLSTAFAQEVERFSQMRSGVRLVPFDFHKECKGMKFERVNLLWDEIKTDAQRFGFFRSDDGVLKRRQAGVFRTNCIDCLDRTNVVQSMLARKALEAFMESLGFLPAGQPFALTFTKVEGQYKNLWADHGDEISQQYAGTGALKSGFTRTGKRTYGGLIDDGVKSCIRYYLNNFQDGKKQDALDLATGAHALFGLVGGWNGSLSSALLPLCLAALIVSYLVRYGPLLVNRPLLQPDLVQQW